MARDPIPPTGLSPSLQLHAGRYQPNYIAPSLVAQFKLDEGYSDETRSQVDNEGNVPLAGTMTLPSWVLAHSETDRAEIAYSIVRSLQTSTIASIVDKLMPLLHMDPVQKLPPEITAEIFSYLNYSTLLTASLTSRAWRNRILDSRLWRELYIKEGWGLDIDAIWKYEQQHSQTSLSQSRKSRTRRADSDIPERKLKKRVPPTGFNTRISESQTNSPSSSGWSEQHGLVEADLPSSPHDAEGDHEMYDVTYEEPVTQDALHGSSSSSTGQSGSPHPRYSPQASSNVPRAMFQSNRAQNSSKSSLLVRLPNGTAKLNWLGLYKQRRRLEENWLKGQFVNFQLPHPAHLEEAHRECVYAIQFSGRWLVSGSRDKTVRVWDLETKRLWYRPLLGHIKSVLCLQFDPDPSEDIIISGSGDRSVIIWRFSTGEKIQTLASAHDDSVLNLKFDKRYLVTCSKDNLIKIWSRRELNPTDTDYPSVIKGAGVKYPSYIVDKSEIPPSLLETDMINRHFKTLVPYSLLITLEGHGAAVNAIQINDNEIVSASGDRLIKVWNIHNGICVKTLVGHQKGIACVQFDNRRIISGSNDDTVRVFDHASGAEVACLHGHRDLVRTVQAGFGDPPGAEEALRLEALAVDSSYWDAKRSGEVPEPGRVSHKRSVLVQNTGSRNPKDIMVLGASLPPGGGGSRWGRILSGSYDGTIIIWRKDREGKWVVGQTLRQQDAVINASFSLHGQRARFASPTAAPPSQPPPQSQMAHSPSTVLGSALHNSAQSSTANNQYQNTQNSDDAGSDEQLVPNWGHSIVPPSGAQQQGSLPVTNAANQPRPPTGPIAQGLNHLPLPNQMSAIHAQTHHFLGSGFVNTGIQPTSRVFKLQFDARKVICASQDSRIVGWDFACGDEELLEACQFFTGL